MAQKRVIRLAVRDLRRTLGGLPENIWPSEIEFLTQHNAFAPNETEWLGAAHVITHKPTGETDWAIVALRPTLAPRRLYAVALHELGHVLGAGHQSRGIMAARPRLPHPRPITVMDRKRWLADLRRALAMS